MNQARAYFLITGDRESKVWIFRDDVPSRFLPNTFSCGTDDFRIQIVDPFGGRHPLLMCHKALSEKTLIPFLPTVILDSNIVSYLHQFVTGRPALNEKRRRTVEEFLRFILASKLNYNPFFYYMEGVLENERLSKDSYLEFSESILRLHAMDRQHFLSFGEIRTDPRLFDEYKQEYGVADFSEMAAHFANDMVMPTDFRMQWVSRLTYAALMKTALIHKTSKRGITGKYEELRDFMEDTFNIALGRERIFALEYFTGRFDGAIPVQRGANFERALKHVRATARDLLLLQLPEFMLVADTTEGVYLSFIASADKALTKVARACRIDGVMAWAPKIHVPLPVVSVDLTCLKPELDAETIARIREMDSSWQKSRTSRMHASETHISFERLDELIGQLEEEVVSYCKH
jgi:hypothetical protein